MLEFYIAIAVTLGLMGWVGYYAITDQDGLKPDPGQRIADLERKVADLERRLEAST